MPILRSNDDLRPAVQNVREIRIGIPLELRDDVLAFYTQALALRPWPPERQLPGGIGLGELRRGVFLEFRHDPLVEPMRRRMSVLVASLDAVAKRLAEREWPHEWQHGLGVTDRCLLVADPVGHRLEVRQNQLL